MAEKLKQRWRKFRIRLKTESQKGSAAIEFAFVAPIFFVLLLGTFEAAIMFFSQAALQNSITVQGRQIRTGQAATNSMTQAQFRTAVCNGIAPLIPCDGNLQIDVKAYATGFGSGQNNSPLNGSGNLDPAQNNWMIGNACDVVVARAFYTMPIYTPVLTWFLVNMSGNKHLVVAATAFRNEPYNNNVAGC